MAPRHQPAALVPTSRTARVLAVSGLVALFLVGAISVPGPAAPKKEWEEKQTVTLKGVKVSLSAPVLVSRSKGYLWFPTLVKRPDGDLLALMSNYADENTNSATSSVCWSGDGGLTWTEPADALYGDSHVHLPNSDLLLLPYYLYPKAKGAL